MVNITLQQTSWRTLALVSALVWPLDAAAETVTLAELEALAVEPRETP